jgi:hypothetical protein
METSGTYSICRFLKVFGLYIYSFRLYCLAGLLSPLRSVRSSLRSELHVSGVDSCVVWMACSDPPFA